MTDAMKTTLDPTTEERSALEEVRAQGKLNHLASLAQDHADKMSIYAHYNQRVDVRDEALALQRLLRDIFAELEMSETDPIDLAAEARSLRIRLHGAFTGPLKNTPLFTDLKRFLHVIEKGGER